MRKQSISLLVEIEVEAELSPTEIRRVAKKLAKNFNTCISEHDWIQDTIQERITPELYSIRVKEL